jgi:hypothetical protein
MGFFALEPSQEAGAKTSSNISRKSPQFVSRLCVGTPNTDKREQRLSLCDDVFSFKTQREKLLNYKHQEIQINIFFQCQTREALRDAYTILVVKQLGEIKKHVISKEVRFREVIWGYAGHSSRIVYLYGMNCLRSLEPCDHGFEPRLRDGSLVFVLCVYFLCLCTDRGLATS